VAALLLTRAMTSMLVGTRPSDPITFAAMAAIFLVIAILATWIPARRAAALDPLGIEGRITVVSHPVTISLSRRL
jgi:ABC-type antimicrobial peptide transport system permease subunit